MNGTAKKLVASFVCAVLVLLSPGSAAHVAFAGVIESVPVQSGPSGGGQAGSLNSPIVPLTMPALGLSGGVLAPSPTFTASPSPLTASVLPVAAFVNPAMPAAPAALTATMVRAAAVDPLKPSAPQIPAALSPPAPGSSAEAGVVKPQAPAAIDSSLSYRTHRLMLRMVAALTGEVNSLRPAGPELTERAITAAADKRAVFSDYDETLADSNAAFDNKLSPDMVKAVQAVRAAGKTVDVISDRPESVLESLSSLPVEARAGMYVAVDAGGRVYRYDDAGKPALVYEAPAMTDEVKAVISAAGDAAMKNLPAGAEPVVRPYTYTIKLPVGSGWEQVRGAGELFQKELAKRGSPLTVRARMAKDPANNPYLVVSVNTKANASRYIAMARGLAPKDIVILGDGMYAPRAAEKSSWLTKLGSRVGGRELADQGNGNDAEMEKGVPGARTYSVGGTGDPRRKNLVVLGASGPEASRSVLLSVASKPVVPAPEVATDKIRSPIHEIRLWISSLRHYFLVVNVENWREYKKLRAAAPVVIAGQASVKDARGFFVDS
ncbi:MAG: hypothetical protein ABL955_09270, partial [Elusimicrobiota bacterium]